jgi:hypothetical protein
VSVPGTLFWARSFSSVASGRCGNPLPAASVFLQLPVGARARRKLCISPASLSPGWCWWVHPLVALLVSGLETHETHHWREGPLSLPPLLLSSLLLSLTLLIHWYHWRNQRTHPYGHQRTCPLICPLIPPHQLQRNRRAFHTSSRPTDTINGHVRSLSVPKSP